MRFFARRRNALRPIRRCTPVPMNERLTAPGVPTFSGGLSSQYISQLITVTREHGCTVGGDSLRDLN